VTNKELDKNAARRVAIIRHAREVTGNVARTCRYYGISRQVFYTWLRRYEAEGVELLGPDGLLSQVTKVVLERALAEEMTGHLGYDKTSTTRPGGAAATAATAPRPRPC
jgi:transposase-like protein